MTNGEIKGTGNSRYLKSNIPANITHQELVNLLRAGTFPVDLNGINAAGWAVLATALNKLTLLSDDTEKAIWGNAADRTVDNALAQILSIALGRARVFTGTYTGNSAHTSGSDNKQFISLGATPKVVVAWRVTSTDISNNVGIATDAYAWSWSTSSDLHTSLEVTAKGFYAGSVKYNGVADVVGPALNDNGATYGYFAIC